MTWTIVSLVPRVDAILASVCVGGLSGCMLLVAANFISEFCQESVRGTLTSCGIIFYGIGLMVSYILGGCLKYEMMNNVCLATSVVCLIMVILVKESPVHLMQKGLEKKAAESIAFYRLTKQRSLVMQQEMKAIRRSLSPQMYDVPPEEKMFTPNVTFFYIVREIMTMLAIEWGWLCNFLVLFIFIPFVVAVGLGPVFYVFAFTSLISAMFSILYLPETKGLTVDVIQDVLLLKQ